MFGFSLARNIVVTTSFIKFIRRCGNNIKHDECATGGTRENAWT